MATMSAARKMMQDRFKLAHRDGRSRIGTLIEQLRESVSRTASRSATSWPTDGQKITLGDTSRDARRHARPHAGHLVDAFQVKDNGKPLTVAYSGGTAFNFVNDVPHFDIYIASQRKMAEGGRARGRHRADDEPFGIRQRGRRRSS